MQSKVILENGYIDNMARNPEMLAALPFLSSIAAVLNSGQCTPCNAHSYKPLYDGVKKIIAKQLPPEQLAKLKQFVGADIIIVMYPNDQDMVATVEV